MSYTTDRDNFIGRLVEAVPNYPVHIVTALARNIMRAAATIQRLEIAVLNGEPPAYNGRGNDGDFAPCKTCRRRWTPDNVRPAGVHGVCQCCRTTARLRTLCEHYGLRLTLGDDARGTVVRLLLPDGAYNTLGGPEDGYAVPVRD